MPFVGCRTQAVQIKEPLAFNESSLVSRAGKGFGLTLWRGAASQDIPDGQHGWLWACNCLSLNLARLKCEITSGRAIIYFWTSSLAFIHSGSCHMNFWRMSYGIKKALMAPFIYYAFPLTCQLPYLRLPFQGCAHFLICTPRASAKGAIRHTDFRNLCFSIEALYLLFIWTFVTLFSPLNVESKQLTMLTTLPSHNSNNRKHKMIQNTSYQTTNLPAFYRLIYRMERG